MPKLSIIVTGRNDNYDGNFNDRLAMSLTRNIQSLPDAEFIFVEWNPYLDRPLTSEGLKKIFNDRVKYYVVHPKYHDRYCTIDGFLEYPAKNVGIRRSQGDFVASINSDIIFAPDLVENMLKELKEKVIYRSTRIDIRPDYLRVHFPLNRKFILGENYGPTNAAGDFLLMDRKSWLDCTGYCEEFPEQRLHKDALIVHLLMTSWRYPVENIGAMTHWRHPSSWSNGFCRSKVGDPKWDYTKTGYRTNKDTWGLTFANEVERDGIIWLE